MTRPVSVARDVRAPRRGVAKLLGAVALVGVVVALPESARAADPLCGAQGRPVVYMMGTAKPWMAAVARALYTDPTPIQIAWRGNLSCNALGAILDGTPNTGTAIYFDPASTKPGNEETCTIPVPDGGTSFVDIGTSDVFATTCRDLPNGLPQSIGDFLGPVNTMAFVVPKASTTKAISATAAYFIYGFGNDSGVAPFTDDRYILKRSATSGTAQLMAPEIGVPPEKWRGTDPGSSGLLIPKIISSPEPQKTIGQLAVGEIDSTISLGLSVLAFKQFGQSCAYYPDSTATSNDKANVRDGHYGMWGPFHFFAKVDAGGNVRDANVRRVLGVLTGTGKPPAALQDPIAVQATLNLVPTCAMKVKRSNDGGQITSFAPQSACGCHYDQVATGRTSCQACTANNECPSSAPVCSYGYCEKQ